VEVEAFIDELKRDGIVIRPKNQEFIDDLKLSDILIIKKK